ncbi:Glycosyltransferase, family GT1 [Croceitalea dokdonensis DOKDO 023]|uniref:Glycosyltransferase, family GT1 n=1 Tax=Croceitalea dokdonensis DOKDO 023 TaxID=1300341 RepID=A0A0P7AW38_9FLAO|nr:glycosyltransferase family protein [Croceitalea dokdonensis]KPM32171.1 Glycosyltransferase, family GT1 [Croceitalea dokdonensis DOKDO 023]
MKVLYAIQGTGNGHLSRARDIIPVLRKHAIELDILVSGTQADIQIPHPIRYRLQGWSFIFGKKGGVDVWKTYLRTNSARLQKEIRSIPVTNYDLIINDFEPVSAWACKLNDKPCVSFSHQTAVLSKYAPKPKKNDPLGRFILQKYAPGTERFGLHFKAYEDTIYTPIIRQEIRKTTRSKGFHYTVYLPAYSDEKILKLLKEIKHVEWEVFSKNTTSNFQWNNISIRKINNEAFIKSMASSNGILCGAGFETPAEALHMGKKLLVIPMKGQYEQQCNAAALKQMGVTTLKSLKKKQLDTIRDWVESDRKLEVHYPDITETIVDRILQEVPFAKPIPHF